MNTGNSQGLSGNIMVQVHACPSAIEYQADYVTISEIVPDTGLIIHLSIRGDSLVDRICLL